MTTANNYWVTWEPMELDRRTVNNIKVIDAFSTDGDLKFAKAIVRENIVIGLYEGYGPGKIQVLKTEVATFFR